MNKLKKYGCLPSRIYRPNYQLFFAILLILPLVVGLPSSSALAQDQNNPFSDLPKASDFLGNPDDFVKEVEGRVMPVLIQFFTGIATIYSLSQLIKSLKNSK